MHASDIVKAGAKLFALPKSYQELQTLQNNGNASSASIAQCLLSDPVLTSQVLRVANSSLYGHAKKIDTVSRAVTLVGQENIFNLVLASSTIDKFSHNKMPTFDINQFWDHSIRTAVTAQTLAKRCNVLYTESYFIAGLMHDIGTMVIAVTLPEIARALYLPLPADISQKHEVEFQSLGFTHADVGGELLETWSLPAHLIEAVRYHHGPQLAKHSPLSAALVQIACAYSNPQYIEAGLQVDAFSWEISRLDPDQMEDIIEDISDALTETVHELTHRAA